MPIALAGLATELGAASWSDYTLLTSSQLSPLWGKGLKQASGDRCWVDETNPAYVDSFQGPSFCFTATFFSDTYFGMPSRPYGGGDSPRISGCKYLRAAAVMP